MTYILFTAVIIITACFLFGYFWDYAKHYDKDFENDNYIEEDENTRI